MNKVFLRVILFLNFMVPNLPLYGFFDIKSIFGGNNLEINFPTDLEAKNQQLKDLEQNLESFKKKSEETNKKIIQSSNDIQTNITKIENDLKTATQNEKEFLNQKINILNDRKQNLFQTQELLKEAEEVLNNHIKNLKEIIENQKEQAPQEEPKLIYYWQDFKQAQTNVNELQNKLESEQNKKEDLNKKKLTEKEKLLVIQKEKEQLDLKGKKLLSQKQTTAQDEESTIDLQAATLDQELILNNEKNEFSNLKIDKLEKEIQFSQTVIENIKSLFNQAQQESSIIEKRLSLKEQDLKTAKADWDAELQKASRIKTGLDKIREPKKTEREKLVIELDAAKETLKKAKGGGETPQSYLADTIVQKIEQHIALLDKAIILIDEKKERKDIFVKTKQISYEIIDSYYKIGLEKELAESMLAFFKAQKNSLLNEIKGFKDKQKEAQDSATEISRKIESLKAQDENIKKIKKDTIFKGHPKTYSEVIANIIETKRYLGQQKTINQQYLTILSELVALQEKHLNQYDFAIKDLESKYLAFSIWKRSSKAISFEELAKAFVDAENFFKQLFWDTPKFLGPESVLKSIEKFDFYDYLSLLLFALFFVISFFVTKKILKILQNKLRIKIIANSLIEFVLRHFGLLFSWLFIYLHILFDFQRPFSFISPLANTYSVTVFYLISIPILLYIFNKLVTSIKFLNQRLDSALFNEKSEYKFTLLVNTFLYATAILLPLKKAFLEYVSTPSEFPNVIFAAYSLILLVVILLFFWKEDVLALIPSELPFFMWLKSKINKYYYPVFIFLMSLFILANPYIGYSNLSWYLAFSVPVSAAILFGMFFVHYYVRKYSMPFFMEEEEEEIKDKFEHAKTYYGFFIISTFCLFFFFTLILISKIWGLNYTPTYLWKTLSQDWVIQISSDIKLGIVQLIILVTFIAVGFLISSLAHKFILKKLFEIFRTEPGTQNTILRMTHYLIIALSIILGFASIQLSQFIFWISGLLALGVGFGLKDTITDFIAGFFVLIERPIEIGNYIELDEKTRGTVHKIAARSTTLRTGKNYSIVIPNKDIISRPVINWGAGRLAVGFEITVIVDYSADAELAKKLLLDTIQKHPLVLRIPGVTVRLDDFKENGMFFLAKAFISSRRIREQSDVASDLRVAILKVFKENNISLALPQRVVHLNQNNEQNFAKALDIKFDKPS
jgi:small-conductance mechanosensitive channel